MSIEEEHEIVQPWEEIPLNTISGRTQLGQALKLGQTHGWDTRLARTVVRTKPRTQKNGKIKPGKTEEYYWVGGHKPGKTWLANKFYITINKQHVEFVDLKKYILEN